MRVPCWTRFVHPDVLPMWTSNWFLINLGMCWSIKQKWIPMDFPLKLFLCGTNKAVVDGSIGFLHFQRKHQLVIVMSCGVRHLEHFEVSLEKCCVPSCLNGALKQLSALRDRDPVCGRSLVIALHTSLATLYMHARRFPFFFDFLWSWHPLVAFCITRCQSEVRSYLYKMEFTYWHGNRMGQQT